MSVSYPKPSLLGGMAILIALSLTVPSTLAVGHPQSYETKSWGNQYHPPHDAERSRKDVGSILEREKFSWLDEKGSVSTAPSLEEGKAASSKMRDKLPRARERAQPNTRTATAPAAPRNAGGGAGFGTLAWLIVGVSLLCLLAVFFWLTYLRDEMETERGVAGQDGGSISPNRIEQLPFDLDVKNLDFRGRAKLASDQGDFRTAIVFLYSHALLYLDKKQLLHLRRGKTNRQYLSELVDFTQTANSFEHVMLVFERAFFGNRDVKLEEFERCWAEVNSLEQSKQNASQPGATP